MRATVAAPEGSAGAPAIPVKTAAMRAATSAGGSSAPPTRAPATRQSMRKPSAGVPLG